MRPPSPPHEQNSGPSPPQRDLPLFTARATTLFRAALCAGALCIAGAAFAVYSYYHSPAWNRVGYAPGQPVLFSHRHHTVELRIDCRYCHAGVETSAFAGMPATHTCLDCHSQLFTDTPLLQPVVASAANRTPLIWNRVNRLPDHVYFNHSIHLAKGIGCTTCHGEIGGTALATKGEPLTMRWCLDCHRHPAAKIRPRRELFAATTPPLHSAAERAQLLNDYHVDQPHLTDCSTCHR
jgi:hypothetical protein